MKVRNLREKGGIKSMARQCRRALREALVVPTKVAVGIEQVSGGNL